MTDDNGLLVLEDREAVAWSVSEVRERQVGPTLPRSRARLRSLRMGHEILRIDGPPRRDTTCSTGRTSALPDHAFLQACPLRLVSVGGPRLVDVSGR